MERIILQTNEQIWKKTRELKELGYEKTSDCYWALQFENEKGDQIIIERE